jgi:hypothetical protein
MIWQLVSEETEYVPSDLCCSICDKPSDMFYSPVNLNEEEMWGFEDVLNTDWGFVLTREDLIMDDKITDLVGSIFKCEISDFSVCKSCFGEDEVRRKFTHGNGIYHVDDGWLERYERFKEIVKNVQLRGSERQLY